MGVKISELSATNSIHAEDYLIINDYENNTTYKGTLDTIIGNFIANESCIYDGSSGYTVSEYVSRYCTSMGFITSDNFSNELNSGIESYLSDNGYASVGALSENYSFITENYLNEYSYITESCLNDNSYITESYLNNNSYVTENYLSENSYVTESYLNNNSYVTEDNFSSYFDAYMGDSTSGYLSDHAIDIYYAISSYLTSNT